MKPKEMSSAYVPARPIRQALPSKTSLEPSNVHRATDITVHVKIDEHGRVIEAYPISKNNADSTLTMQAISAAKQWIFEPAKLHDKEIASDHTIVFRFRPVE
jgi:hypothetical protein